MYSLASVIAVAVVAVASAQPGANVTIPKPWPASHVHTETMFVTGLDDTQTKPVYYDFPTSRYRADLINLNGVNFKNQSSYWLNTTLFLYTFDLGFCVELEMGFGMMKPTWFLNGNLVGGVWRAHKAELDNAYHYTAWVTTLVEGQGSFDYFALNNTLDDGRQAGAAYTMSAPSPEGLVVNEYSAFTPMDFSGAAGSVFTLPTGITCINGTASPLANIAKWGRHVYGDVLLSAAFAGVKLA